MPSWVETVFSTRFPRQEETLVMGAEFAPSVVDFFARWSGPSTGFVDHMVAEFDERE